ncbi:MAG: flavodoxin family protein [Lachnospiraceae bacterium]|nr:flavodoxin family protein [Lachnospiraceae bacterium]
MFKVLGISSGRVMGNAEVEMRECLMEMEKLGEVDVRITRLRTLKITECDGSILDCVKDAAQGGEGLSPIHDDFDWLKEQILWADAIVFSDPSFCYIPTSEVITLMNRALGAGKEYREACRKNPKLVGLICVGGSDTVDFNLPMQFKAFEKLVPGMKLVDQFYCDWIRGKGYIADQPYHTERARLMAKRMINALNGYDVPAIKTRILKLNPLEYKDDDFVDLEPCPVCHQSVVEMVNIVFMEGTFKCAVCGATGHIEHHNGKLTYVWDDDSVAHNRLHKDHDGFLAGAFAKAHAPVEAPKAEVKEFPFITPGNELPLDKPRILGVYAGPHGGTSEILARKALETATADGKYEGALINILDINIHFCVGCLICKVNSRYRGMEDECVLKDEDLWMVERCLESSGIIWSFDAINGFTYNRVISFLQRFGHGIYGRGSKATPLYATPKPNAQIISSFDDDVVPVEFALGHLQAFYTSNGPIVDRVMNRFVPLEGDGILANPQALGMAAAAGAKVKNAVDLLQANPAWYPLIQKVNGMCPACGLDLIEIHPDMTVSCALCDAHGKFAHRFGQNVIEWDEWTLKHCRRTPYGGMLHFKHIDYSQSEDRDVLDDHNVHKDLLAPYVEYGKLVTPPKKK